MTITKDNERWFCCYCGKEYNHRFQFCSCGKSDGMRTSEQDYAEWLAGREGE
jgi:hypothetical protein